VKRGGVETCLVGRRRSLASGPIMTFQEARSAPTFTAGEIGAGRTLFATAWRFVSAAGSVASLPRMTGDEVAFVGRSNVGKSSLINALTNHNGLARTSRSPGRTQELVFFAADAPANNAGVVLVDMPGYGYAVAPKAKVAAWNALSHAYFRGRANLKRVYVLVDARRGLAEADAGVLATLDAAAVSGQIVLTKADEVDEAQLAEGIAAATAAVAAHPAAFPDVLATSARTGAGIPELRAAIARLLVELRRSRRHPKREL
jgi:GTP-binding protein